MLIPESERRLAQPPPGEKDLATAVENAKIADLVVADGDPADEEVDLDELLYSDSQDLLLRLRSGRSCKQDDESQDDHPERLPFHLDTSFFVYRTDPRISCHEGALRGTIWLSSTPNTPVALERANSAASSPSRKERSTSDRSPMSCASTRS